MNPSAPYEIWAADLPRVRKEAEQLMTHRYKIMVFLRRRERDFDYQYRGRFIPEGELINDPATLKAKWDRLAKKRDLAYVFRLKPVDA